MRVHLRQLGVLAAFISSACAAVTPPSGSGAIMSTNTTPTTTRDTLVGTARNAKARALLECDDSRVIYMTSLAAWPEPLDGRRVRATGTLVTAARLPRATQDASGAWSQGVVGDSKGETWLDDGVWTLVAAAPWTVTVADGSGNITTLSQAPGGPASWQYSPVTPTESSSGLYSGGAPASGELNATQADRLWALVDAVPGAPALGARPKGTLYLDATSAQGRRELVIPPGGAPALEAWVTALRQKQ
ncbi:MAG: hypothetical protein FJ095_20725 [Deltaproteobacteria bacterium]|nr:hypothetical protein [Deltaproteobacteria bacterium]